jgi:hypothetical protein
LAPDSPGVVWEAYAGLDLEFVAYVVTERGNVHRVWSYSDVGLVGDEVPGSPGREELRRAALLHANCPLDSHGAAWRIDVTDCGKLESTRPMPEMIYGWWLYPLGENRDRTPTVYSCPFCRFRMALWRAEEARLRRDSDRALAHYMNTEGSGHGGRFYESR